MTVSIKTFLSLKLNLISLYKLKGSSAVEASVFNDSVNLRQWCTKTEKNNKGGKILLIQSSHATDPQVFSTYFKKIIAIKEVFF